MIQTIIEDPQTRERARVIDGALRVYQAPSPPPMTGVANTQQYLTGLLGTTGLDSGSTAANVLGTLASPVKYKVSASLDYDIHIMRILVFLSDSSITLNRFGFITALTNGINLTLNEAGNTTYILKDVKTSGQLIAQGGGADVFGDNATLSIMPAGGSTGTDAQAVGIPMWRWIPNGLRIGRGTADTLTLEVRDDLTGLTEFYVRIFGYKNIPVST